MIDRYKRFKSKKEVKDVKHFKKFLGEQRKEVKHMKHFKKFLRDQRGVSPVIGVILMVAVTVVMGAVIAGFVYGYLGTTSQAPNVALSVIDDPKDAVSVLVKHNGGETISANEWEASLTTGKDTTAEWDTQTYLGAVEISTGTVLDVAKETDGSGGTAIAAGWYHFVAYHLASDTILLDTNVLVR